MAKIPNQCFLPSLTASTGCSLSGVGTPGGSLFPHGWRVERAPAQSLGRHTQPVCHGPCLTLPIRDPKVFTIWSLVPRFRTAARERLFKILAQVSRLRLPLIFRHIFGNDQEAKDSIEKTLVLHTAYTRSLTTRLWSARRTDIRWRYLNAPRAF
jgi:hypothetical protein